MKIKHIARNCHICHGIQNWEKCKDKGSSGILVQSPVYLIKCIPLTIRNARNDKVIGILTIPHYSLWLKHWNSIETQNGFEVLTKMKQNSDSKCQNKSLSHWNEESENEIKGILYSPSRQQLQEREPRWHFPTLGSRVGKAEPPWGPSLAPPKTPVSKLGGGSQRGGSVPPAAESSGSANSLCHFSLLWKLEGGADGNLEPSCCKGAQPGIQKELSQEFGVPPNREVPFPSHTPKFLMKWKATQGTCIAAAGCYWGKDPTPPQAYWPGSFWGLGQLSCGRGTPSTSCSQQWQHDLHTLLFDALGTLGWGVEKVSFCSLGPALPWPRPKPESWCGGTQQGAPFPFPPPQFPVLRKVVQGTHIATAGCSWGKGALLLQEAPHSLLTGVWI